MSVFQLAERDHEIACKDIQLCEQRAELAATNQDMVMVEELLEENIQELGDLRGALMRPKIPAQQENFQLWSKMDAHVIADVRRCTGTLRKRVHELRESGFLPIHQLEDVPNCRNIGKAVFQAMRDDGVLNYEPQPNAVTGKRIRAYSVANEIDVESLMTRLGFTDDDAREYIVGMVNGAGRVPANQRRITEYMDIQ